MFFLAFLFILIPEKKIANKNAKHWEDNFSLLRFRSVLVHKTSKSGKIEGNFEECPFLVQ